MGVYGLIKVSGFSVACRFSTELNRAYGFAVCFPILSPLRALKGFNVVHYYTLMGFRA